jgi:hypothetical protein
VVVEIVATTTHETITIVTGDRAGLDTTTDRKIDHQIDATGHSVNHAETLSLEVNAAEASAAEIAAVLLIETSVKISVTDVTILRLAESKAHPQPHHAAAISLGMKNVTFAVSTARLVKNLKMIERRFECVQ